MPLNDYYENIDEIVPPEKKEPEKQSTINIKLIIYLITFCLLFIFIALQFVLTYIETAERRKTVFLIPIVRLKQRAIGPELDQYFKDNEYYPPGLKRFTMRKKFFTFKMEDGKMTFTDKTLILDPFTDDKEIFGYKLGPRAVANFEKYNPNIKVIVNPYQFWMIYSVGPDKTDDKGDLLYDPTNGLMSNGDIITWSLKGRFNKGSNKIKGGKRSDEMDF